ncbi:hypothetical protein ACFFKU_06135 [Kineococcus gynurae]|uniref:Uncharacterized protein n=1 Tax=Kineococcus gynurae TaxID=452979 RepID=A0ABV5LXV8_9ACTN
MVLLDPRDERVEGGEEDRLTLGVEFAADRGGAAAVLRHREGADLGILGAPGLIGDEGETQAGTAPTQAVRIQVVGLGRESGLRVGEGRAGDAAVAQVVQGPVQHPDVAGVDLAGGPGGTQDGELPPGGGGGDLRGRLRLGGAEPEGAQPGAGAAGAEVAGGTGALDVGQDAVGVVLEAGQGGTELLVVLEFLPVLQLTGFDAGKGVDGSPERSQCGVR